MPSNYPSNALLNPDQQEAVTTVSGPLLVLAGAGSGKTRVVTLRIVHLIENKIPSSAILGLTFTNKASAEMKERILQLTNDYVLICTFHSLGVKILREAIDYLEYTKNFSIYDQEDSEKLIKVCLDSLNIGSKDEVAKNAKHFISTAKNEMQTPAECEKLAGNDSVQKCLAAVYSLYQQKLQECNAVDFDDLLYLTVRLLKEHDHLLEFYQNRWTHFLIDEYQDTNQAQYEMIRLLSSKTHNLCVVGDPDQSIYSWRGANIRNILDFEKDYPDAKIIRLEQNYRSVNNILNAANNLITNNDSRYAKNLWSDKGDGEKIKFFCANDEKEEARHVVNKIVHYKDMKNIPLNEMVVFYRTNSQSRIFEDFLLSKRIPYTITGGISFYKRREIKDILSFLRLVQSSSDLISFVRMINIPKRGFGEVALEKLRIAASEERLAIVEYCSHLVDGTPMEHTIKLSAKQKEGLKDFINIIHELRRINNTGSLTELVKAAIIDTRYKDHLKEDPETSEERQNNIEQLVSKAAEWEIETPNPSLELFLEELSLKSSLDDTDLEQAHLNLMTLHNGKGLEFDVAFLVGFEEDILPHINSKNDQAALEEERRLCYVGITRAKQFLHLSHTNSRFLWGAKRRMYPSRFLREIPSNLLEKDMNPARQEFKSEYRYTPVEDSSFQGTEEFESGDMVFHREFGLGRIQSAHEGSAGLTYVIHFSKDNATRSIVGKYAHLKKL